MPPIRSASRSSTPPTSATCCWRCCGYSSTIPTCSRSISVASATPWSTSTRTPTSPSICGCGCIAGGSPNICCVGDDDQSIYGWRGAEVDNILRFEKDFPGAKVIRLERNYRSKGHILGRRLRPHRPQQGPARQDALHRRRYGSPVAVFGVWDDEEEARTIGDDIEALHKAGQRLDEIAILVRASFQMRAFEDRFVTLGLPYRVDRRPALLRAPGDQGCHRLPGGHAQPGQRLEVRAHRQRAQARPRRYRREARQRVGSGAAAVSLYQAAREIVETEELDGKGKQVALRSHCRLRALAWPLSTA